MAKRWTAEEDRKLKKVYPFSSKADITAAFDKSWPTIHRRAIRLGLRRDKALINEDKKKRGPRKDGWTAEEEETLRIIYPGGSKKDILGQMNRSWQSISVRARSLGLKRDPEIVKSEMIEGGKSAPDREDFWSDEEDNILREVYPLLRKQEIQDKLPDRSWTAIRGRAIKLEVTRDKDKSLEDSIENSQKAMLKKHGVKSAFALTETQEKIRKTNMERLGVEYPTQSAEVRAKVKKTVERKYGARNVFQTEKVKKKSRETCIQKYGVEYPTRNRSVKAKTLETVKKNNSFELSDEEIRFFFHLREVDPLVECQVTHPIAKSLIDYYSPAYNLWIQYDGAYWHGQLTSKKDGPRQEHIRQTEKRDRLQNKIITNLVRFSSTEVGNHVPSRDIKTIILKKLNQKSKEDTRSHQYLKKLQWSQSDTESLNFDHDTLRASDFKLDKEEYSSELVKFIEKYEWLGSVGTIPKWCFTARHNKKLAGVVMVNEPTSYSLLMGPDTPKLEALIQRGATASWTPKNLGSRLVMYSCRWMVQHTTKRLFVGYGDPKAREIGTIYQACNFDYLGDTFGTAFLYQNEDIKRGMPFSAQTLKRTSSFKKWCKENDIEMRDSWFKDNGYKNLKAIPTDIKKAWYLWIKGILDSSDKIPVDKKHKYVILIGKDRREERELIKARRYRPKTYPKRVSSPSITNPYALIPPKQKRVNHKSRMTSDKRKFIVENYKCMTKGEIADTLNESKRWVESVVKRLQKEGTLELKNPAGCTRSRTSPDKIKFILSNRGTLSRKEIAAKLGETERWVKRQIRMLDLSANKSGYPIPS